MRGCKLINSSIYRQIGSIYGGRNYIRGAQFSTSQESSDNDNIDKNLKKWGLSDFEL